MGSSRWINNGSQKPSQNTQLLWSEEEETGQNVHGKQKYFFYFFTFINSSLEKYPTNPSANKQETADEIIDTYNGTDPVPSKFNKA